VELSVTHRKSLCLTIRFPELLLNAEAKRLLARESHDSGYPFASEPSTGSLSVEGSDGGGNLQLDRHWATPKQRGDGMWHD